MPCHDSAIALVHPAAVETRDIVSVGDVTLHSSSKEFLNPNNLQTDAVTHPCTSTPIPPERRHMHAVSEEEHVESNRITQQGGQGRSRYTDVRT